MTYQETAYQKFNPVDFDGNLISSGGGSGGGGDASATNQQSQIALLGNTAITGTTMPTGGLGLFGWLSAIWQLISDRFAKGTNTAANSLSFTLATDGIFATFAGLANDAASATGSIHAKLRGIAETLSISSIGTRTPISASISSVSILTLSSTRKGFILKNSSTVLTWYISYGSAGSSSDYTYDMLPGDVYIENRYRGAVNAIASGAIGGTLLITELN